MIGYTDTYTKTMINLGNTACMSNPFPLPPARSLLPRYIIPLQHR